MKNEFINYGLILLGTLWGRILVATNYFRINKSDQAMILPYEDGTSRTWLREITLFIVSLFCSVFYLIIIKPYSGKQYILFSLNYAVFMALLWENIINLIDNFINPSNKNDSQNPNNTKGNRIKPGDRTSGSAAMMLNPFLMILLEVLLLSGWKSVFAVGCFGGLLVEISELYKIKNKKPPVKPTVFYWLVSSLMIIGGGILTTFYGVENISALAAVQMGASAPLIIQRFRR